MGIATGQVSSFVLGAPIKIIGVTYYWRICLIPCILIPLVRLAYFSSVKFDTPYFYIVNQQKDLALEALREVLTEEYANDLLNEESEIVAKERENKDESHEIFKLLREPHHIKIVLIGVWIFFLQQLAGINAINFYSTKVFHRLGTQNTAYLLTGLWGIVDLSALIISLLFVVDRFKRKTLLLLGCAAVGSTLMICGLLSFTDYYRVAIVTLFTFIIFFNFSLSPMPWTIISEMTHSKLMFIPSAAHWIFAFAIAQFFPYLIQVSWIKLGGTFFMLGGITVINMFVGMAIVKETKGKSKTTIYKLYGQNRGTQNDQSSIEMKQNFQKLVENEQE